jgi:hypothetical protein
MRIQRVVLEHHGDVTISRLEVRHNSLPDADLSLGHLLEPGEHTQSSGLSAARGADEDHELAVMYLK